MIGLIICFIFPPAIPFVILYYLFRPSRRRIRLARMEGSTTDYNAVKAVLVIFLTVLLIMSLGVM